MTKNTKRIIFHLPFLPDKNHPSSTNIRPIILLNEFKKMGYNVFEIIGTAKERRNKFQQLKKNIKNGLNYEFMYSESSTAPNAFTNQYRDLIHFNLERKIFKFCSNIGIKIGLFYRDIHWRFGYEFKKQNFIKKFVIKKIYPIFYKCDLKLYRKFLNILFLPSKEMLEYIPELRKLETHSLPPGIYEKNIRNRTDEKINILYVGGLSEIYDVKKMIKVISSFPKDRISFTICTRLGDYENVYTEYKDLIHNNINIVHLSGKDLDELYSKADICCLFLKPSEYHKFQMPVKLFEYISYQKPIISHDNSLFGEYISSKGIGWSINYYDDSLKELIHNVIYNNELHKNKITENLKNAIKESTWTERVNCIIETLNKD